jgi:tetratricopeptide (TPR) repeat protein
MQEPSARRYLAQAEQLRASLASPHREQALGDFERARPELLAALDHFRSHGDVQNCVRMVLALRDCWWESGHLDEGRQWLDRLLKARLFAPEPDALATALDVAGALAYADGDPETARCHMVQSLAIRKTLGDPAQVAQSLNHLANLLKWGLGERAAALPLMEESLREARRAGNQFLVSAALLGLGTLSTDLGHYDEADAYLKEALASLIDEDRLIPFALEDVAALVAVRGEPRRALRLGGAAEALHERLMTFRANNVVAWVDRYLTLAREALPSAVVDELWMAGRALTVEEATAYALDKADIGRQ